MLLLNKLIKKFHWDLLHHQKNQIATHNLLEQTDAVVYNWHYFLVLSAGCQQFPFVLHVHILLVYDVYFAKVIQRYHLLARFRLLLCITTLNRKAVFTYQLYFLLWLRSVLRCFNLFWWLMPAFNGKFVLTQLTKIWLKGWLFYHWIKRRHLSTIFFTVLFTAANTFDRTCWRPIPLQNWKLYLFLEVDHTMNIVVVKQFLNILPFIFVADHEDFSVHPFDLTEYFL